MEKNHITNAEIARMVNKSPSTIFRWEKDNPALYEVVYLGCLEKRKK